MRGKGAEITHLFLIVIAALLYTAPGLVPGRVMVPLDLPRDLGAWKSTPSERVRVSNSLLSDVVVQFVPWDVSARRLIGRGEFPWRNPHASDGAPLFANPQAALLSPFTWPRLIFGLRGWALTVLLKLLAAMFGMRWLARVAGAGEEAATLSALVFGYAGFTTVWGLHPHTNVFVVLPALLAAAMSKKFGAVTFLAALSTFGGHPETLFVGILAIVAFLIANRERLLPFLGAAFAGFLIAGVQLVPFFLLLAGSHVRLARVAAATMQFRKLSILSEILPGYLGSPLRGELDLTGAIPFAENFHQRNAGYVGALVLLTILLAWRRLPAPMRRGVVIGTCGLLLSWWIPGVSRALKLLPLVRWMALDYFAAAFVLFAALAAGPALLEVARTPRRAIAIVLIACGVVLLIAGALPALDPPLLMRAAQSGIGHLHRIGLLHQPDAVYQQRLAGYLAAAKWTAFRRIALPGICWIAFAIGLLLAKRRLIAAAAVAELIAFGFGYLPSIRVDAIAPEPPFVRQIDARWFVDAPDDVFPANLATLYGVRDVRSYDVLTSESETRRLATTPLPQLGVRWWITGPPPRVQELANATLPPPASNAPPEGFGIGLACTIIGLLSSSRAIARDLKMRKRLVT